MRSLLIALAAVLSTASPVAAYFEEVAVGARGISMGPAALSLISDGTAGYWNPAGLADLKRPEFIVDYAKPYGVEGLDAGALAIAGHYRRFGLAAGWHRLAANRVYAEDLFTLSAGRAVAQPAEGHRFTAGATFKFGRVSFQPFGNPDGGGMLDFGSQSKGSLDVGARWATPWNVEFAWTGRDLLEPRYQFVPNTGGNLKVARQEFGAALRWNRESTITLGWSQLDAGASTLNAGIEILFYDVFAVRSGVTNISRILDAYGSPTELQFNGGFGIYHRGYHIDAAATTNRDLGASYRLTMRVPFAGDVAR